MDFFLKMMTFLNFWKAIKHLQQKIFLFKKEEEEEEKSQT